MGAKDMRFEFHNFSRGDDLLTLLRWAKSGSPHGLAYFLSYLSLLRVPSETIRRTRAFPDGRVTEFAKQTEEALIGSRTYKTAPALAMEFAFRKNAPSGRTPIRPSLCGETADVAHGICPAHSAWTYIRGRVGAGGPSVPQDGRQQLQPTAERNNGRPRLRPRRPLPATIIIKSGAWLSACYKNYPDVKAEEASNISTLLLRQIGSGCEDHGPEEPKSKHCVLKKRAEKAHVTFRNDLVQTGSESSTATKSDSD